MPLTRRTLSLALAAALAAAPATAFAQGTQADYERALKLRDRFDAKKIAGAPDAPVWIPQTNRFHYRLVTQAGHDFVLVDAATGDKKPAFDHEKIAAALSTLAGKKYTGVALPFNNLRFVDGEKAIEATVEGTTYRCTVADSACRKTDPQTGGRGRGAGPGRAGGPGGIEETSRRSPDG